MAPKQIEHWNESQAELFRLLIETATDYAIFLLDPQGHVASWNPGAQRIKGYRADEIIGRHFSEFYPQEAIDRGWPEHELKVASAEGRFEDEGWRIRKDGSRFWANVVITALKDQEGNLRGFSKITRDLTQRKEAEENARRLVEETTARRVAEADARVIQEQRERLRVTLESIGDAVITTDAECRVEYLNPVAQRLLGWQNAEVARRDLTEVFRIINEKTRQPVANPAVRALAEGIIIGLANHTVLISRDGTERSIDDSAAPIRDADGRIVGAVLVFRDISERRRNENLLREQQEWLRVTLASIGDAVIATDRDSHVTFLNPVAQRLTGWTQADAQGKKLEVVFSISNEKTGQSVANPVARVLRDGTIVGLANHTILEARDGTRRPIDDSAAPIRDAEGNLLGVVLTFRDVTESRQAETALRQSERELAEFFENATLALHWVGPDGIILRANQAELDLLGYRPDEYVGRPITDFHADQDVICDILTRLRAGERLADYPARLKCKDGSIKDVLIDSSVLWRNGKFIHTRCFTRDVTRQKQAEQELRDNDRRKDEFLATLAHELRNPLAPIRNSLQILRMPRIDAEVAEQSRDVLDRQVQHLVRLVDDLLDVSRVMRGKIELRREHVELSTVIARAVETAKPLIELQRHDLEIIVSPESLPLDADPVRLAQVVGNLLTNAAKYTEANGRIWVTASREGDLAILSVRDNGIGIAPDMLPHVFDLFVQADHTSTKSQGGLGIGLTLVKNLVEMHGGSVTAHSRGLGEGSEFIVQLPLVSQDGQKVNNSTIHEMNPAPTSSGLRLLVVDDNRDAASTLAMLLRLKGHQVEVANDGPTALAMAEELRPDVIFLDIGMPRMDGYEVARRIRQQPELNNVVLAALTGWGQQEDRRRTAAAGFNHHLVKPPELKIVDALLAGLVARATAETDE